VILTFRGVKTGAALLGQTAADIIRFRSSIFAAPTVSTYARVSPVDAVLVSAPHPAGAGSSKRGPLIASVGRMVGR
jgi:hypothetical protein